MWEDLSGVKWVEEKKIKSRKRTFIMFAMKSNQNVKKVMRSDRVKNSMKKI